MPPHVVGRANMTSDVVKLLRKSGRFAADCRNAK